MAFLDPQEKMWKGKSGRCFKLTEVKHMDDTVSPFNKVCNLTTDAYCHGTIFRFPLRRVASGLSSQCYDMGKIHLLLEALREEGKLLLLFLRSIDTIEVHKITGDGMVSLQFGVSISQDRENIRQIRYKFMKQVEQAYSQLKYNIKQCISTSFDFHIEVNKEGSVTRHHWHVVNHVGSGNTEVLQCAASQHVFPWVGVALELGNQIQIGSGRVFCFLPMPPDVSSPFPVHVNGTFGLSDDRRTLRWQGVERKNDPAAQWNSLLVSHLLPSCYNRLIMDCIKVHKVTHSEVYKCWPNVKSVNAGNWKGFLVPFLNLLLAERVLWTDNSQASGDWIHLSEATIIERGAELAPLIHSVLTACGLKIVRAQAHVHDAVAMSGLGAKYLTHCVARAALRRQPRSYSHLNSTEKLELLKYCLGDANYDDLDGLGLIPLVNNTFACFCRRGSRGHGLVQDIYLCSAHFPRNLFLNMDDSLVSLDDGMMMVLLEKVAASYRTQLMSMSFKTAVQLIKQRVFPYAWQALTVAEASPDQQQWLQTFWQWVQPYELDSFTNDMVVPLSQVGPSGRLRVTRLSAKSPVLYLTETSNCSPEMMCAISKMPVFISQTSTHPFFRHSRLQPYLNRLTPDGLLNALVNGCSNDCNQLTRIPFTESESKHVAQFLGTLGLQPNPQQVSVLINLPIFSSVNKSDRYAIVTANQCSFNNSTINLPDNCDISDEN